MVSFDIIFLYLAHDGLTLTALDGLLNLTVLRYQTP
jgi:hypothetical protein